VQHGGDRAPEKMVRWSYSQGGGVIFSATNKVTKYVLGEKLYRN
jgi:hypothetical protein